MKNEIKYIFVDLEGALVKTDLFFESILKLIKKQPFIIVQIILWILQGKSVAKKRVENLAQLNPEYLPYEPELIDYLKEKKTQNKIIILATNSNQIHANNIAKHLGIFNSVLVSNEQQNLKGKQKLTAIRKIVGNDSFTFAGNSFKDKSIWKEASSIIFVNASHADIEKAKSQGKIEKTITSNRSKTRSFFKEMRLQQWAKNVLVFVPLFTSHSYLETLPLVSAVIAFFCFSFCASGVYFLNDMLDLDADRRHKKKCFRPLASGRLPLSTGIAGALGFPLVALVGAWFLLPLSFFYALCTYYFLTNAYSFILKSISTIDVMTLAILYTLRIVAGAEAVDVTLSSWLVAFSVFIFVSLAYLKRYIEISSLPKNSDKALGRGYSAADAETMFILGVSNITASVLIMALYINSTEVASLYKSPKILWFLCMLVLYWGNRIWVGARRGKITDDPVVFAIKDSVSRIVGGSFLITVIAAKYIQI